MSKEIIVRLTSDHIKVKGGEYVRDYEPKELSIWCMKCGNNGECMSIDKPACFQPRDEFQQTDCPWK